MELLINHFVLSISGGQMKTKLFFVTFFLLFSFMFGYKYEEKIEKSFNLNKDAIFKLSNINGEIILSTHNKNEVLIKVVKSASKKSTLDNVKVIFEYKDNKLKVYTKKHRGICNFKVDFFVKLPEQIKYVKLESVNGKINTMGKFKTMNSNTVNGKIMFEGSFSSTNLKTVNGSINLHAKDNLKGNISAKTVNGSVKIEMRRNSSFTVNASTINGSIKSDFEVSITRGFVGSRMEGTVNEGKHKIIIKTVNGNIKLFKI